MTTADQDALGPAMQFAGAVPAVPVTEDVPRRPILQYGVDKAAVESL